MTDDLSSEPARLTTTQWLICIMAAIGFAFDIYELLMLPLIVKPAVAALSGATPGDPAWIPPTGAEYVKWARTLFFVPAIAGGVFGLLGGYLTDLLGRRRVLTWSILLYAFSATAAGFSTNLWQLLFFRCLVFIGVCVEFVAAVAWLAELFPEPKRREKVLGYTQAFSSFGGLLVAVMAGLAAVFAQRQALPAIHGGHEAWRYTLISGLIPAIPLLVIRPFLPESPAWEAKRAAGTLRRPSLMQLFSPELRLTTIVTTLAFASTFGLAFGAIQQTPQIISRHVDVQKSAAAAVTKAEEEAAAGGTEITDRIRGQARANEIDKVAANVQTFQEVGGLVGRLVFAYIAVMILSRRNLFRVFQIPALIFVPLFYWWMSNNIETEGSLSLIRAGMFVAGVFVIAQMSFWGNYIPLVFPVHLRGTGESFAANIGGRVLGTMAAFITITLAASDKPDPGKMAFMGACVAAVYGLLGFVLTQFLPEPKPEAGVEE
ncbi:MAG: MFS transporter [Planctomyces sp.]|nr:MFS transporter [Planctomyces sp.]